MTNAPRPAGTLLVGHHDVVTLLPMSECIDAMTDALRTLARGGALLPLRQVVRLANGRDAFALMPAALDEPPALGAKVITVFPGNDATPYDSHQGAVLLFDFEVGRLIAILDASTITALRTAAVTAVATRLLSRAASTRSVCGVVRENARIGSRSDRAPPARRSSCATRRARPSTVPTLSVRSRPRASQCCSVTGSHPAPT